MSAIKADIVVTRHQALVDLLKELGYADNSTQAVSHVASPDQVRGLVVAGVLPLNLAAEAEAIISVDLRLSADDRGKELTLQELRDRFLGVSVYKVTKIG